MHEPMAVLEWLGTGKGMVLLDHTALDDEEMNRQLDRILGSQDKGLLFIAVAGGGAEVAQALKAADDRARKREHVGLYHIDDAGRVRRVAGRRLAELDKVGSLPPVATPLSPARLEEMVEQGRKERTQAMEFVRGATRRFPHLTVALIAVCVLFFAMTTGAEPRSRHIYELLANRPDAVRNGEVWRLLTYALLHDPRNATHLIVNMLSLYSVGSFLEPLLGRLRLGLTYLASTLAGGVASTLLTQSPSVGASGAVWGLMGATLGLLHGRRRVFPSLIARSLRRRLVTILAINVLISFLPHIDRYCHFGGGLIGYLLGLVFSNGKPGMVPEPSRDAPLPAGSTRELK